MPRKDGTGPKGQGPKTGRGQGVCNPAGKTIGPQGQSKKGSGKGAGKGLGAGKGPGAGQGRGKR